VKLRLGPFDTALHLLGKPRSYNPDAFDNNLLWNYMAKDLDSEYWRLNSARWDRIKVPLYSVGNWGGTSLHLRGKPVPNVDYKDEQKLRYWIRDNVVDVDYQGSAMPPPEAVKSGKVKPLSDEDRLTLVRWIDLTLMSMRRSQSVTSSSWSCFTCTMPAQDFRRTESRQAKATSPRCFGSTRPAG